MNTTTITESLERNLQAKLRSLLPIEGHCAKLDKEFKDFFEDVSFTSDPYIEQIAFYQQDSETTLASLREAGTIEKETAELFARYFGCKEEEATLYSHQKQAIEDVCSKRMNLVVCSGTGSGKTESFLIPLINSIIKERKEKKNSYESGVRAMLLYPMNALVNDQLQRLRKILRCAQASGELPAIPYAEDISFGIYTGDVDTLANEKKSLIKLEKETKDLIEHAHEHCHHASAAHPYLSDDASIKNELTKRSQWNEAAADIFITNYSMLELLLLHGKVKTLFTPTWRYIVLDEAHSYDGSLGTEIAWLLRRVKKRTDSSHLCYLATSATLIEEGDENERRRRIQDEFASKIFPAEPESFSVQFGALYDQQWPPCDEQREGSYCAIGETVDEQLQQCIQEVISKELHPKSYSLLSVTQWREELKIWLASFEYLKTWSEDLRSCALGDALVIAQLLLKLQGQQGAPLQLAFTQNDTIGAIQNYLEKTELEFNSLLRDLLGFEFKKDIDTHEQTIKNWTENTESPIDPQTLILIVTQFYKAVLSQQEFLENDVNPLEWTVQWTEESCNSIAEAKKRIEGYQLQMERVEDSFHQAWARVLESDKQFPLSLNDYITGRPHLQRLYVKLSSPEKENCILSQVVDAVFGRDDDERRREFQVFVQLLSLTKHAELRNKPLMDVRFHQQIKGVNCMGICFDDEQSPHLMHDDDRISEVSTEGRERQIFTLGCCIDCGHPYLLAYSRADNLDTLKSEDLILERYKSATASYLHAFSWVRGESESAEGKALYLDYLTGRLSKGKSSSSLCIHHSSSENKNGDLTTCPVCEGRSANRLISPYKSQIETTRVVSLLSLVNEADADASPMESNSTQGRKLLAFSDSRAKAASLVQEFDRQVEERLIERFLLECLESLAGDSVEHMFARVWEMKDDFIAIRSRDIDRNFAYIESDLSRNRDATEDIKQWCDRYKNSLLHLIPMMREKLIRAGAKPLLTREYSEKEQKDDKEIRKVDSYSEIASIMISCLSVLRQSGRRSLLSDNIINVYSFKQRELAKSKEKTAWHKVIKTCRGDEHLAQKLFHDIYRTLYKRTQIDCTVIDSQQGDKYLHDSGSEGNTLESKNHVSWEGEGFSFSKQLKLRKKYSNCFTKEEFTSILNKVFLFLTRNDVAILIRDAAAGIPDKFKLNIDDVRFELTEEVEKFEKYKNILSNELYYRIEEHTAQLSTEQARLYQQLFSSGKINILSSSTTFEMGVDLGNLNCVFLCNMPPKTANYKQRAGRAGRRAGSPSYVFTFVGDSSHDRYFADQPHKLIFGKMSPPKIYLDNASFRAKHLRAEAFHHFIKDRKISAWEKCGKFFLGATGKNEIPAITSHLRQWAKENRDRVQEICTTICDGVRCEGDDDGKIPYPVVYDLCFQLTGFEADVDGCMNAFCEEGLSHQLAGVHFYKKEKTEQNFWISPLNERFEKEYNREGISAKQQKYLRNQSTIQYIAKTRVFPRYGFPCDLIELLPAKGDSNNVSLSRDLKQGIYEYSPGQTVIANKRIYESSAPVFYTQQAAKLEGSEAKEKQLYRCRGAAGQEEETHYYMMSHADDKQCPICGAPIDKPELVLTSCPDAFRAHRSLNNRRRRFSQPIKRVQIYNGGKINRMPIPQSNLAISESRTRELLYFNGDSKARVYNTEGYLHTVRTDMVMWEAVTPISISGDAERTRYAWQSAIEAIVRATALVCEVNERDIGGLYTTTNSQPHLVLYDNSASGSGVIMRMFTSEEERKDPSADAPVAKLCYSILEKALELCISCDCHRDNGMTTPLLRHDYLKKQNDGYEPREYYSCYKCLKNYNNQFHHSRLDAHDAAYILEALRGVSSDSSPPERRNITDRILKEGTPDANYNDEAGVYENVEARKILDALKQSVDVKDGLTESPNNLATIGISIDGKQEEIEVDFLWEQSRCLLFLDEPEDRELLEVLKTSGWHVYSLADGVDTLDLLSKITRRS